MTVGIAAIAENEDQPICIVSGDRMVTVGQQGGIEYEDTTSKVENLIHTENICSSIIGAGPVTYLDELINEIKTVLADQNISQIQNMNHILNLSLAGAQSLLRQTAESQIFSPLGYSYPDLRDEDTHIPDEIQRMIAEQTYELRDNITEQVSLLVGGVGFDGPAIYQIGGADYANWTDTGYAVVGSGTDSARLSFIRRQYDKDCTMRECLFTVLEAKRQSEERQGVGQDMDLNIIQQDSIRSLDETEIEELRNRLIEVDTAEQQARQDVLQDWSL